MTDNIESFSGDHYQLPNSIFRNAGKGKFEDVSSGAGQAFGVARGHRGLVVADLDGDGRLDMVVTALGEAPEIWRNVTANGNHWIDFRLEGHTSNRDGLGAQIRLAGQMNTQSSSVSYASSTLGPVHFGLGALTTIPRVEIEWPSGKKQTLANVPVDRLVKASEP